MADRTCNGTNDAGDPCGAPPAVVGDDGWCDAHRPGSGKSEMSKRGQRGGLAATAKNRSPGLDPDDLPPLDSPEAAKQWAEIVGRNVASGRLGRSEGNTILKAISRWLSAEEHREAKEALEEMKRRTRLAEGIERFRPADGPDGLQTPSDENGRPAPPDQADADALPAGDNCSVDDARDDAGPEN